jgi:hypothetical protein
MSDPAVRQSRSRRATRQLWSERLERFSASGLTVVAFCQAEGVCSHSFYYWKRLLAASPAAANAPRLLPVRLQPPPTAATIEVVLPHGPLLRLPAGCDLDFVRSLVSALGDKPC